MCRVQRGAPVPFMFDRGENIRHHCCHVAVVLSNSHWSGSEGFVDFAPPDLVFGLTSILINSLFKHRKFVSHCDHKKPHFKTADSIQ